MIHATSHQRVHRRLRRGFVCVLFAAGLVPWGTGRPELGAVAVSDVAAHAQSSGSAQQTKDQSPPAQSKKDSDQQSDRVVLGTRLVTVTVTVSDRIGRFMAGLGKENFEVYDDDVKQDIAIFSTEDSPVSLGVIYDVSGSMHSVASQALLRLRSFFETSKQEDEFFIVAFGDRPKLVQDYTSSPGDVLNSVAYVKSKGMTALYDAAYLAVTKLQQGRYPKKALLIISDGEENKSRYSYKELRDLLLESNSLVYAIGVGRGEVGYGPGVLQSLAGPSGGAYFPEVGDEVTDAFQRIAIALRHQYVLGFYPTANSGDGKWHKLKVKVKASRVLGKLVPAYRKSYFSSQ